MPRLGSHSLSISFAHGISLQTTNLPSTTPEPTTSLRNRWSRRQSQHGLAYEVTTEYASTRRSSDAHSPTTLLSPSHNDVDWGRQVGNAFFTIPSYHPRDEQGDALPTHADHRASDGSGGERAHDWPGTAEMDADQGWRIEFPGSCCSPRDGYEHYHAGSVSCREVAPDEDWWKPLPGYGDVSEFRLNKGSWVQARPAAVWRQWRRKSEEYVEWLKQLGSRGSRSRSEVS